jgi:hypothetical protein
MRQIASLLLLSCALSLSGCVAVVIPIAAAGMIGKQQIDAAKKRTRQAEVTVGDTPPTRLPPDQPAVVEVPTIEKVATTGNAPKPSQDAGLSALDRLAQSSIKNAYVPFARYALEQAGRRDRGEMVRSAVLVEQVSLLKPDTIYCGNLPMAVLIDIDIAPGTPAEIEIEPQNGFGPLLQILRESGIRVMWTGDMTESAAAPILATLRKGDDPALRDEDIVLLRDKNSRKQEQKWQLARSNCVIAIAGDRKADFDELYLYLRNPDYAIRLESFMGRGWFDLPHPAAAVDSLLVATPNITEDAK